MPDSQPDPAFPQGFLGFESNRSGTLFPGVRLRAMRAFDQRAVLEGIEIHLFHQPRFVSKSRIKLMNQPFWSQYRLRLGDFRIYYDVDDENRVVNVLRILMKTTDQTPEAPP